MLTSRPPIVVILGHVDHGKTTLLDYLRKSNIAAREAGGITQNISSFQLQTPSITFIDTPGHAAFSAMRSRGSSVADIAILIISSTDGIMPQTKESFAAITAANIPYVVALTKSDLPTSDPDKVKTQLLELGIVVEDLDGPISALPISAKTGAGVPELLDAINLISSVTPPQADPEGQLEAFVLESRLDSKKGPLATVIIKSGTLKVGDTLPLGKIRALIDCNGQQIKSALPSTPVEVLGLTTVPEIGSNIAQSVAATAKTTTSGSLKIILKADVGGSLEALLASFGPEINILSSGTGDVTENDIELARTSGALIYGFNVKIPGGVAKLAEVEKVAIFEFKIIYELLDHLHTQLHPVVTEVITGQATILAEFKINSDRIAGCKVTSGILKKGDQLKIKTGVTKFKSLKTGKTEVESVKTGVEFGAMFSPYLDFKVGDTIIAFTNHG